MTENLNTDFKPDSRTGLLLADVKSHYLKEHCPQATAPEECLTQLEKDVHVGYNSTDHGWFRRLFNPSVLYAGEAIGYAYRFKEYHPYLAKHGFPLPFVVNDEDVKKELFSAADDIRAVLEGKGLKPGTSEYQLAFINEINEWGKANLAFGKDCSAEMTADEAFKNKCGDDTEKSTILYAMFEHAGLAPSFVKVFGNEPTPKEFERISESALDERDNGHICLGIRVVGRDRLFLVDPLQDRLDPSYGDISEYSLFEYVKDDWFNNRIWNFQVARLHEAMANEAKSAIEMSPENFIFHQILLGAYLALDRMTAARDLDRITRKVFGKDVLAAPYFLYGEIKGGSPKEERLEDAISSIGKIEPRAAALVVERLAYNMLILGQDHTSFSLNTRRSMLELAFRIFKIGMEFSERYLSNFVGFIETAELLGREKDAVEFFKGYSEKRPISAFGHYLAARTGLRLAPKPLIQDAQRHLDEMCRLADCSSTSFKDQILELRSNVLLYSGKGSEAISVLEEEHRKDPNTFDRNLYYALFFSYVTAGRFSDASNFIVASIKSGEKKMRNIWIDFIYGQLGGLEFKDKDMSSKSGIIKFSGAELLKGMIDVFSTAADSIGEDENFREHRSVIYILLSLHALEGGDVKRAGDLFNLVEEPISDEVQAAVQVLLSSGLNQINTMPAGELKEMAKFADRAAQMFKGVADREISFLYLMIAGQFMKYGEAKKARALIETAFGIGGKESYDFYFENVAKVSAADAFEDKSNKSKVDAALSALELCVETKPHCPMKILRDIKKGLAGFEGAKDAGRIKKLGDKIDKIILEDK